MLCSKSINIVREVDVDREMRDVAVKGCGRHPRPLRSLLALSHHHGDSASETLISDLSGEGVCVCVSLRESLYFPSVTSLTHLLLL